jgi:hypothetical protein
MKTLRDRIERVAATDFTVLIEGASGPEPHPNFMGVFSGAASVPPGAGMAKETSRDGGTLPRHDGETTANAVLRGPTNQARLM